MTANDRYRSWDAAYVLGSLSPAERREYERHLTECPECVASLGELSGLPGLLSSVPGVRAFALAEADSPDDAGDAPGTLVSHLAERAVRARRRTRLLVGAMLLGVAAAAVALVIPLVLAQAPVSPGVATGDSSAETIGYTVSLDPEPGVPVAATVRFVPEAWGTRLEMDCSYKELPAPRPTSGDEPRWQYVMYVTDVTGAEQAVGSWTSTPGSTMHPSLSTGLSLDQIVSVDVRVAASGKIVLTGAP